MRVLSDQEEMERGLVRRMNRLQGENNILRASLVKINNALLVSAAEYVPAIVDVFNIIDATTKQLAGSETTAASEKK